MLELGELRQTRFYQEVREETLLEKVPSFLALGLSVEQLAETLELDVELVRQAAQGFSQNEQGENTGN